MQHSPPSDTELVEKARRLVTDKNKIRWLMLFGAAVLFALLASFYTTGMSTYEESSSEQFRGGFAFGVTFAVAHMALGLGGAAFLAKFISGFASDFRPFVLLVRYHDRLIELGKLPDDMQGSKDTLPQ